MLPLKKERPESFLKKRGLSGNNEHFERAFNEALPSERL
jgi:hypothetical protein